MAQFIRLKPVFKETIWGGSALAQRGFDIPGDHTGEAWVTSAPSTPAISSTSPGHGARHPRRHRPAGSPAEQRYHLPTVRL